LCQLSIFIDLIHVTLPIGQQVVEQIAEMAILDDNEEIAFRKRQKEIDLKCTGIKQLKF
jgi:hypothetical protein